MREAANDDPAARRRGRIALAIVFGGLVAFVVVFGFVKAAGRDAEPEVRYRYAVNEDASVVWARVGTDPGEQALRTVFRGVKDDVPRPGPWLVTITCENDDSIVLARGRFGPRMADEFTLVPGRPCP